MIGDLILAILKWWKQNITCIHDYQYFGTIDYRYEKCTKCDKLKHNSHPELEAVLFVIATFAIIAFFAIGVKYLFEYYKVESLNLF